MRFIKGVAGKCFPVFPDFLDQLLRFFVSFQAPFYKFRIFQTTIFELDFQFVHQVNLFFTHCLTQRVRVATGKSTQSARLKHHLFLINRNSIGIFQVGLHQRMIVFNFFLTMFSFDKGNNVFHRTRTIKSIHRYQILEAVRLQVSEMLFHSGRLELENTGGISIAEQFQCERIIFGQMIHIDGYSS